MPDFSDERIARILKGRRDVHRVPFPGAEHEPDPPIIGIRILVDDELDDARLEAAKYIQSRKFNIAIDPEAFDRAIVREVLSRACVDPDDPSRPFFPSAAEVRALDSVIVATLHHHYLDHADEVNPTIRLSDEAMDDLIDKLGKDRGASGLLSSLDAPTLRSLLRSMARRLASSPAGR